MKKPYKATIQVKNYLQGKLTIAIEEILQKYEQKFIRDW